MTTIATILQAFILTLWGFLTAYIAVELNNFLNDRKKEVSNDKRTD